MSPNQSTVRASHARDLRERFYRGVAVLATRDPCYWVDDRGPDVVNTGAIIVGDHRWDVTAQRFASRAEVCDTDGQPDPWLTGLAHLGIAPAVAADFGFDDDPAGELARHWAVHIWTLRVEANSRPPRPLMPLPAP